MVLLIEEKEWDEGCWNLDQAGEEEDEVSVAAELRHVEGEPEVERAQGEPGQAAEGNVKIPGHSVRMISVRRLNIRCF